MTVFFVYDQNDQTISFASSELKSHLEMLQLPELRFSCSPVSQSDDYKIELCVMQDSVHPHPADDGYYFSFTKEGAKITGTNSRSVLLGVYAYLRKIGFRFIRPGQYGTVVPQVSALEALFVSAKHRAGVRHRGVCIEGSAATQNILDFIEWMPKLGYNSFFMQFRSPYVFLERWYRHIFNPYLKQEHFSLKFCDSTDQKVIAALELRGLLHHRAGHGWTSEAIGRPCFGWHTDNRPLEPEIQPLLAMVNGERVFWRGAPSNTNLCYSNQEVIQRLVDCVADYSQAHPEVDYLHFWLADEFNNICECDDCVKTTPSDQYIDLLNAIDAELTRRNLSTHIVFLLYQELLFAPQHKQMRNPDRFTMMFAPISRTFEASYPVGAKEVSLPDYQRNHIELPTNVEENLTYLKKWQEIFSGDSFVYDYPLGRAHYGDLGYMKIARVLSEDIRALPALGLNGYISCQELRIFFPTSLPNYVMGLLLDDPTLSFEEICADYFLCAYGKDGKKVLEYLNKLSELTNTDYFNGKGPRLNPAYAERLREAEQYVIKFLPVITENLQNSTKQAHFYWELLEYHASYCLHMLRSLTALTEGRDLDAKKLFCEFHTLVCKNEPKFQSSLDVYRITEVSTKYTKFYNPVLYREENACTEPKRVKTPTETVSWSASSETRESPAL